MIFKKYVWIIILFFCMSIIAFGQDAGDSLFTLYSKNSMSAQSADCYGDYLVLVTKYESKIGLYNLKHKRFCFVFHREPKMEMIGKLDVYHANNSSFGTHRYIESDSFPLLYVSNRCNNDKRGVLDVFRIVPMKSKGAEDYDSLLVQQVQTIYFPMATDKNALGSPWAVVDREENCIYTYSRINRSKAPNKGVCRISKFSIPSIGETNEVYLSDEDILDSYEVEFKAPLSQGACIHRGGMYIAQGIPSLNNLWLRVIDLKQQKLVKNYDLTKAGFTKEPEGCFIYNGHLMLATGSKQIFKMNISINK